MKTCPICAIPDDGKACGDRYPEEPEFRCTRPRGHEGDHASCGSEIHPLRAWAQGSGSVRETQTVKRKAAPRPAPPPAPVVEASPGEDYALPPPDAF